MWKLHFLFIGPKSAKFQALLILQKEIYIFKIFIAVCMRFQQLGDIAGVVYTTVQRATGIIVNSDN